MASICAPRRCNEGRFCLFHARVALGWRSCIWQIGQMQMQGLAADLSGLGQLTLFNTGPMRMPKR